MYNQPCDMLDFLTLSPWLSAAILAWGIAQLMKLALDTITKRKVDFSRLVDTGGMPSSHTSFVTALATSVGLTEGFHSVLFAITCCFSAIIVYDATNLRRSAGYHARVLNEIVPKLLRGEVLKEVVSYRQLRELLGHNPSEVLVGSLIGIFSTLWFFAAVGLP